MKTVREYAEPMAAHIDKSLLEAEGVPCEVLNENLLYASIFAGSNYAIQLVVADDDYDRALGILNAAVVEEPLEEPAETEE